MTRRRYHVTGTPEQPTEWARLAEVAEVAERDRASGRDDLETIRDVAALGRASDLLLANLIRLALGNGHTLRAVAEASGLGLGTISNIRDAK